MAGHIQKHAVNIVFWLALCKSEAFVAELLVC